MSVFRLGFCVANNSRMIYEKVPFQPGTREKYLYSFIGKIFKNQRFLPLTEMTGVMQLSDPANLNIW